MNIEIQRVTDDTSSQIRTQMRTRGRVQARPWWLAVALLASSGCADEVGDASDEVTARSGVDQASCPAVRHGMTWVKYGHFDEYGVDAVGCDGGCDPYAGDTPCTGSRPILCYLEEGLPNPGIATSFYAGWKGGHIALTPPIAGTQLTSLAAADQLCAALVGPGYVMAEFHHQNPGGGWNWYAYGDVTLGARAWTHINDQPANCWNSAPRPAPCSDADGDGVPDDRDVCPGTQLPEGVPTIALGVNRYAETTGDGVFDTAAPPGGGPPPRTYTIRDTAGCSCEQIIERQGLGAGHAMHGCSGGVMDDWIASVGGG